MTTFARLLKLTAPFRAWVLLSILLTFLTIASSVALMATSAYLISRAAIVTEVAALSIAITSVRLFAISRAAFRYLERLVSHRATFRILAHLRAWFYASVEPLAPAGLTGYRSGDLLTRSLADIETLEGFYVRVVVPPIAAALVVAFACLIVGAIAWQLALALLLFLLIAGIALPLAIRWLGASSAADLIAARARLNAALVDEVQGMADLLVFDQGEEHRAEMLSLSRALSRVQERLAMLRGASNAAATLLASLAAFTLLLLAIPLVRDGAVDGVYLAMLPLVAIASFEAVQPLALALQQLEASHEAGRRVFELVDAPAPVREPDPAAPPGPDYSIEMRAVSFGYPGRDALALDNVSFTLPMGERLAVVGPSGAGKSTIVNLLLRFWEYDRGEVTLGGCDLRLYRSEDVRALIGVMAQDVHLFNSTLRDNLLVANPDATNDEIDSACRQTLLLDFIRSLPDGYDTLVGENGLMLSGGERQRLAIARVILKDAPIIILDEPTANLDAVTERRLMQSLEPFLSGRTVLIISHRPVALAHTDRTLELSPRRPAEREGVLAPMR